MNLRKLLCCSLMWMSLTTSVFGQTHFPLYSEVQQTFLNNYKAGLVHNSSRIVFEKKRSGWYVRQVEFFPTQSTVRHELFWSAKESKYRDLTFLHRTRDDDLKDVVDPTQFNFYDILPCFGYKGWEKDALETDHKFHDLTPVAKALCYSGMCFTPLLRDVYLYDTGGINYPIQSIQEFDRYGDSAEWYLNAALDDNPGMMLGAISIAEQLNLFRLKRSLFRSVYFNIQDIFKDLKATELREVDHVYARNMLRSCPPNSMLFVTGEADVLPLYYESFYRHFRTDVVIINLDWLEDLRYQKYLNLHYGEELFSIVTADLNVQNTDFIRVLKYNRIRQRQLPGEKLSVQKVRLDGFPDNNFQIEDFDLAREYTELKFLLQFVTQQVDNEMDNGLTRYKYFPTDGVRLALDSSFLQWKIPNKSLNRNDLIFLDLLNNQLGQRPVCMVGSTPEARWLGIDDRQLRGLVYKVVGEPVALRGFEFKDVSSISSFQILNDLLFHYEWTNIQYASDFQIAMYSGLFLSVVSDLTEREKYNGAKSAVLHFFKVFGPELWNEPNVVIHLADYLFVFGEVEKGNEVLRNLNSLLMSLPDPDLKSQKLEDLQNLIERHSALGASLNTDK